MNVFRWAFVVVTSLMVGLGFAVLSGNAFLAATATVVVFLVAAYLSYETREVEPSTHETEQRRSQDAAASGGATYAGPVDEGTSVGGDGGLGGDGGGGGR